MWAPVRRPRLEHPKRPVSGFACARTEVSGERLWGWARDRFGGAEAFFARFFVINYCPLVFMEGSGRNRTPDKLPAAERACVVEADRAVEFSPVKNAEGDSSPESARRDLSAQVRGWIEAAGIGGLPEGVMYAILLGNAATPHIDRWIQPRTYGTGTQAAIASCHKP